MKVCHGIHNLENFEAGGVVTLGNFDGVHLGHQMILERVLRIAKNLSKPSVVFTFHPHPVVVLNPQGDFKKIFDEEDQEFQLRSLGVALLNREPFSLDLSQVKARDFFEDYIWKPLRPQILVVGYDFAFGSGKEGSIESLGKLCQEKGVSLEVIPPYKKGNRIISSSLLRDLIGKGDVEVIPEYLGRRFYLKGQVILGDQRGRELGFPTANLLCPTDLQVCYGVYISFVYLGNERYFSVTNVGYGPTFSQEKGQVFIETHLFDFDGDLYDKILKVEFVKFIRCEKKFTSVEQLKLQVDRDIKTAKGYFYDRMDRVID